MNITDEMIEAAARAMWARVEDEYTFDEAKTALHTQWSWALEDARLALEAAAPAIAPEPVEIKQLEWKDRYPPPCRENDIVAESVIGTYTIRPSASGKRLRLWFPGMDYNKAGVHESVETAKRDAQADFEARIRSALITT